MIPKADVKTGLVRIRCRQCYKVLAMDRDGLQALDIARDAGAVFAEQAVFCSRECERAHALLGRAEPEVRL